MLEKFLSECSDIKGKEGNRKENLERKSQKIKVIGIEKIQEALRIALT